MKQEVKHIEDQQYWFEEFHKKLPKEYLLSNKFRTRIEDRSYYAARTLKSFCKIIDWFEDNKYNLPDYLPKYDYVFFNGISIVLQISSDDSWRNKICMIRFYGSKPNYMITFVNERFIRYKFTGNSILDIKEISHTNSVPSLKEKV